MKTLRLLLLGLLTPLFMGSVFAFDLTADEITYLNNNKLAGGSFNNVSYYYLFDNGDNTGTPRNLCYVFSGLTFTNSVRPYWSLVATSNLNMTEWYTTNSSATYPYFLYCNNIGTDRYSVIVQSNNSSWKSNFSVDYYWVLDADKIVDGYLGFDVQGLLDSYNNCQSNLNDCDTITNQCLEDKASITSSLNICNSDKNSLQNYNDALSSQLNECLNNQGTGSYGTGITLVNNSLFWYLDDNLLSLPITNNLFLPLGYQGALDSGNVLYISKLGEEEPTQYYFTEEDKISIIDILSYLFVFILGIGIIFSLIKLFKKIFTH